MTWREDLPKPRGRLLFDEPLAPLTWLRVGGAAEVLFLPADEDDLARMLASLPAEIPVTVLGVGSNVIVRDGGVEGLVVRLGGRAFREIEVEPEVSRVVAGAAVLDAARLNHERRVLRRGNRRLAGRRLGGRSRWPEACIYACRLRLWLPA